MSRHPIVKWAQRPDTVYITIDLLDAQDVKLKLEPDGKFLCTAATGKEKTPYEVDLDLFDKIDVNESKASIGLRTTCYSVKKAETKWWSRLIKQEGKAPVFLKVDWDKWVDEDDDEEAPAGDNMDFGDLDFSKLIMGGGDDALDDEFDDSSDSEDENVEEAPADSAGSDTKLPASVEDEAKPAVMRKISTGVVCVCSEVCSACLSVAIRSRRVAIFGFMCLVLILFYMF